MTKTFTIAVTGQSLIKHDIRNTDDLAFQSVRDLLEKADFAFTNFESTIDGQHGGWPLKGSFFGSSQPVVLDSLKDLGFHGLSLSNNHAFDLGPSGILSTLEEVEKRGFLHAGIGRNQTMAARAGTGSFNGRKVALVAMDAGPGPDFMYAGDAGNDRPERPGVNRLHLTKVVDVDAEAFDYLRLIRDRIGYTDMDLGNDSQPDDRPPVDPENEICIARAIFRRAEHFGRRVKIDQASLTRHLSEIRSAAKDGGLVIAYLHHHHWASDWYQVSSWVGDVAKACIDAGAAMFVSHGAPVLQPVEIYRNRPIFYSFGNFIFHVKSETSQWTAPEIWESVVGLCAFDEAGELTAIDFHPVVIGASSSGQRTMLEERLMPHLAQGSDAERILKRFQDQSLLFGSPVTIIDGIARIVM